MRHACGLETSRHVIAKLRIDSAGARITAPVRNISSTGLSVFVNRPLVPGSVLNTELSRPSRFWCSEIPLRVVYSLPHPGGEFIVGGAFARELTTDELHGLLGNSPV